MIDAPDQFRAIVYTVAEILKADGQTDLVKLLADAHASIEHTDNDNWNGGTALYTVHLAIDVEAFVAIRERIENIETTFLEKFNTSTRHCDNEVITKVRIVPKAQSKIDWARLPGGMSRDKLIDDISFLKNTMISVATGGQRIQSVNEEYAEKYQKVDGALQKLNFKNPNPHQELWGWHGKWSSDFPHWRQRRAFISEMYGPLLKSLQESSAPEMIAITVDLSAWEKLGRAVDEIKIRQKEATTEEQCQVVGLLCREIIVTLAQSVFNASRHPILDLVSVSKTDAKRMLDAYISVELAGDANEALRKQARSTIDLANVLTHKRSASKRDAALCATATISLINFIGILEKRI